MAILRRRAADEVQLVDVRRPEDTAAPPAPPPGPDPAEADTEAEALPAQRMRGTETMYGYVVGLELLVVAILNLVITTGPGAPKHPQTTMEVIGAVASVGFFGVLQLKSRTIVGFAAIIAAFFVTLPRVPNALTLPHVFSLALPVVYALILTQRQRKALGVNAWGRRRGPAPARAAATPAARARSRGKAAAADSRKGRGGKAAPVPTGPRASSRYTPPKAKRRR